MLSCMFNILWKIVFQLLLDAIDVEKMHILLGMNLIDGDLQLQQTAFIDCLRFDHAILTL